MVSPFMSFIVRVLGKTCGATVYFSAAQMESYRYFQEVLTVLPNEMNQGNVPSRLKDYFKKQ